MWRSLQTRSGIQYKFWLCLFKVKNATAQLLTKIKMTTVQLRPPSVKFILQESHSQAITCEKRKPSCRMQLLNHADMHFDWMNSGDFPHLPWKYWLPWCRLGWKCQIWRPANIREIKTLNLLTKDFVESTNAQWADCAVWWLRIKNSSVSDTESFIMTPYSPSQKIFYIEYFSGVNIFQGWILLRGEYFSGVNNFQGWILFRGEYFSWVNNFQGWIFFRGEYFSGANTSNTES